MSTEAVIAATAALVAIVDPLATLPVYLSLRRPDDVERHRKDAFHAALAVTICLLAVAVGGAFVLGAMGVSVEGLRCAGGLLVTYSAFAMVQGEMPETDFSAAERQSASLRAEEDLSIYVPLSIPMLAGPGAISSTITLGSRPEVGLAGISIAIAVVGLVTFVTFWFARFWFRILGEFGLRLATRLFGILVMAVGVQMVVLGARQLWQS